MDLQSDQSNDAGIIEDELTNILVLCLGYSVNLIYKQIDSTYIEC
jgi:hypothetical protein